MQRFALFAVGILMCTARREEAKDQRDLRVDGGSGGDFDACGDAEFQKKLDDFHIHMTTQGNEELLKDASKLFEAGSKALRAVQAENIQAVSESETLKRETARIRQQVDTLTVQVKKDQRGKSNTDFLVPTIKGSMQFPFMQKDDRYDDDDDGERVYMGCTPMIKKGGVIQLVDASVNKLNKLSEQEKSRDFQQSEFLKACFQIAVEVLKADGEFENGDTPVENAFIDAVLNDMTIQDLIKKSSDDYKDTEAFQCHTACTEFGKKVDQRENHIFATTSLAKRQQQLNIETSNLEVIKNKIVTLTNVLNGCERGLGEISSDVTQLAERYEEHSETNKELNDLDIEKRKTSKKLSVHKKKLMETNIKIETLAEKCKDKDKTIKNLTCEAKAMDARLLEQQHKVRDQSTLLEDARTKKVLLDRAMKAYRSTKIKLYEMLKMWYSTFYLQIQTIQKITQEAVREEMKHTEFVEQCMSTEQVFQEINDLDRGKYNLPHILTYMKQSINSEAERNAVQTAADLKEHLKSSFSVYNEEFTQQMIQEEETSGLIQKTYDGRDDREFQRFLMKFMAYCPRQDKSFCGTYLIGWLNKTNCENIADTACGKPCILTTGNTCQAPNGAEDYLLELRIENILEGLKGVYTELETQLIMEKKVLQRLAKQIQELGDELEKHNQEHGECKTELYKLEKETLVQTQETIQVIDSDLKAINAAKVEAIATQTELLHEGRLRMEKIYQVTQKMKNHNLNSDEAIRQIEIIKQTHNSKIEQTTIERIQKRAKRLI